MQVAAGTNRYYGADADYEDNYFFGQRESSNGYGFWTPKPKYLGWKIRDAFGGVWPRGDGDYKYIPANRLKLLPLEHGNVASLGNETTPTQHPFDPQLNQGKMFPLSRATLDSTALMHVPLLTTGPRSSALPPPSRLFPSSSCFSRVFLPFLTDTIRSDRGRQDHLEPNEWSWCGRFLRQCSIRAGIYH